MSLNRDLSRFLHNDQISTVTQPRRVSITVKVNKRLQPLTRAERINLASHEYVILDGSDRNHLQLYYHTDHYGCTPYPKLITSVRSTHFKLADIIGLRDHLISLPFGSRLVRAMECSVISVEQFRKEYH